MGCLGHCAGIIHGRLLEYLLATTKTLLGGSNGKVGIAGKVFSRRSHLAHLIKAKL
jgi:hypothetical protein